ncbi:hypothetical protein [Pseudaminobacter sp. NGMCC 1.201702]|uniref:hypothetical protein n=1 Tax=Pseudaminobacter sp. NGMCC 1.201702 TaxID=3391825 RepID=UPI0039F12D5E
MIALDYTGTDARLRLQLEGWLEQIAVNPHYRIKAFKGRRRIRADKPAIPPPGGARWRRWAPS